MRRVILLLAASALGCAQAWAGGFVPVADPAGGSGAAAIGINDQGEVAGSYTTTGDDMIGFAGSIDGDYETFSYDGHPTQARAINNNGTVTGFFMPDANMTEFVRTPAGVLSTITKDGVPVIGIAEGINASGKFVGDYRRTPPAVPLRAGYQGKDAAYVADVVLPFPAIRVAPRGINNKGDISGWFVAAAGEAPQGFVIQDGVTTVLTFPEPNQGTFVEGLNNKGELSGSWYDADGNSHGFALASDLVTWTSFDAPTGTQTQAWQINNKGQIAVSSFDDATGPSGSYIYCPGKGGVCTGKNEKAGKEKSAKSAAKLTKPQAGTRGLDPDAHPRGRNH